MGHIYDPSKRFCQDEYILDVNGLYSYPTIISYYNEYDGDEKWVSFVNAHQRMPNKITVTTKTGKQKVFWLAAGEMKLITVAELLA